MGAGHAQPADFQILFQIAVAVFQKVGDVRPFQMGQQGVPDAPHFVKDKKIAIGPVPMT